MDGTGRHLKFVARPRWERGPLALDSLHFPRSRRCFICCASELRTDGEGPGIPRQAGAKASSYLLRGSGQDGCSKEAASELSPWESCRSGEDGRARGRFLLVALTEFASTGSGLECMPGWQLVEQADGPVKVAGEES
jgi:hypothetical protein